MKTRPRKRLLGLVSREQCMEACLLESDFECRSANWFRQTGDCHLSDQDRHSVSQSEVGDQRLKSSLVHFYGPSNLTLVVGDSFLSQMNASHRPIVLNRPADSGEPSNSFSFAGNLLDKSRLNQQFSMDELAAKSSHQISNKYYSRLSSEPKQRLRKLLMAPASILDNSNDERSNNNQNEYLQADFASAETGADDSMSPVPALAQVDYLENNCVYEPNKLCEFRKLQNRVLKTVDSIYQEVATWEECKQKCLNAPYRCYSFDYGDTSERVCRTSHLDQPSLMSVREPYLEVVGAITYELASCFNVSIQCRAKEMVAMVSASKIFKGKIYAKSRPNSCMTDVKESLKFELAMRYQDDACDVRSSSNQERGVFSQDLVIQHHDRIVTTQDVGLSVYCHYDLGNRSVTTNQLDLAIERAPNEQQVDSKQSGHQNTAAGSSSSSLTITGLATTVVKSPNVTMRITNMNGQPVSSATVGDRLALMFEIREKSSK